MSKSASHMLFGRLAIRRGWVTAKQLEDCLKLQARMGVPVQLGMLLVERGLLKLEQVQTLLMEQERRLRRRHKSEGQGVHDVLFGTAVVQQGLATEFEVNACLREQAKMEERGINLRLGEVLVRRGILTPPQVESVLKRRQKTVFWCAACSGHYFVWWSDRDPATGERRPDARPPAKVRCPGCGGTLVKAREEDAEETPDEDTVNLAQAEGGGASVAVVKVTTPTDVLADLILRTESRGGKRMFGPYMVEGEIMRGGQSLFLTGRRSPKAPLTGVKIMVSTDPIEVRDFLAEAWLLERLRHPHILRAFTHGIAEGHAYVELEIVDGLPLDQYLHDHGPLSPAEIGRVFVPVLNAVEHIHRMGFVHRDLKPANIILRAPEHQRPVLIDFGLSCPVSRSGRISRHPNAARTIEGSPPYMSPEQAGGLPGGLKRGTDVYSLGATLYEMLTGLPPFGGDHPAQIIARVAKEPPQPPSALNPDVHPQLEAVCMKAMARDPKQRYRWPRSMKTELVAVLRSGIPLHALDETVES